MTTTRSGLAAVLALVLTSAALVLPASATSKPSFTNIAQYAERHHVCVGKVTKLTGNKVTKGAKKYNIVGSLSCETSSPVSYTHLTLPTNREV